MNKQIEKECNDNTRMLIMHMLDVTSLCIWSCMVIEGNKMQTSLAFFMFALGFRVEHIIFLLLPPTHPPSSFYLKHGIIALFFFEVEQHSSILDLDFM
jgi:hypothetical protein